VSLGSRGLPVGQIWTLPTHCSAWRLNPSRPATTAARVVTGDGADKLMALRSAMTFKSTSASEYAAVSRKNAQGVPSDRRNHHVANPNSPIFSMAWACSSAIARRNTR